MIPAARFRRQEVRPYPGAEIEIEGRSAIVRAVGAGRVQVDFNPPLAGKTLVYELVVKKTIVEREEKVRALLHRRIPNVDLEKFKLTIGETDVSIEIPEEATYLEGVEAAKKGLATEIQNFLPNIEKVVFTEVFLSQKPAQVPSQQEPVQAGGSEDTQSSP